MTTSEDNYDEKAKAAYSTVIKESSAECKLAHAYIEGLKLAYPEVRCCCCNAHINSRFCRREREGEGEGGRETETETETETERGRQR